MLVEELGVAGEARRFSFSLAILGFLVAVLLLTRSHYATMASRLLGVGSERN